LTLAQRGINTEGTIPLPKSTLFVATAISKGKWNFSEYGIELREILSDDKVDSGIRGKE
jgi:hypothetical protein